MPPRKSAQVESVAAATDDPVTAGQGVTPTADAVQSADVVLGQLVTTDDPIGPGGGAELPVVAAPTATGYIVRCLRERGIWRAKRFWPPENVPVRVDELAEGDLEALEAEPLLSVTAVSE